MRALLVHNPNATATTPEVLEVITAALSAELKLDVEGTKRREHAGFIASGAVDEGYDVVVALGGDGTVNEVVQGVAGSQTRFAVIPGGSTNVFARSLGLPNDAIGATAAILRSLREERHRTITLGRANERWFTFCAGWGYDAEVVRMVERLALMKRTVRQATFLWCGVLAGLPSRRSRITASVAGDDGIAVPGVKAVVACNSFPYTYLGPLPSRMCPHADLEGDLDLTALTSAGLIALTRVMRTALTTGHMDRLPHAQTWHDQARFELSATGPLALQLDGEYVGDTDRITLRSVHRALHVVA